MPLSSKKLVSIWPTRIGPNFWIVSLRINGATIVTVEARTPMDGAADVVRTYRQNRQLLRAARRIQP